MPIKKKRLFITLILIILLFPLIYIGNKGVIYFVHKIPTKVYGMGVSYFFYKVAAKLNIISLDHNSEEGDTNLFNPLNSERDKVIEALNPIKPMREIDVFDDDAKNWSTIFGSFHNGLTVFDANGDGKLDVYFCQDGQNWTRPTDEEGVLLNEPRHQHNVLYINQGNDKKGIPRFIQAKDLARENDSFIIEELLIENYLFPREKLKDSEKRPGRQSVTAAAADFNNDGRLDLLVGNGLPGIIWSHPNTQRIIDRFAAPKGRKAKQIRSGITGLGIHLIKDYEPRNDMNDQRESSRGLEFVGANCLFLNMGDQDKDGLSEWKDVSREVGIEGKRHTTSLSIADIDLDGDLDIYEGNCMDFDYWPGGATKWAGGVLISYTLIS